MGFFSKLFEKKVCSICGGEIGLLGNRKLEDGNCCKNCARKLSPWFEERRHSTVDQIKEQLAYREENAKALQGFRVSKVIGERYKMYIEEVNGVPTRFLVSDADSYMDENPDIIEFKDLLSCTSDVQSDEREVKRDDGNGNEVSYSPPRYETDYDFHIKMQIGNNPYFDDIEFQLNSNTVTLETRGATTGNFMGLRFTNGPVDLSSPHEQQRYQEYMDMCQEIEQVVQRSRMSPQEVAAAAEPQIAEPQAAEPQAAEPQAPAGPKFCPNCGAAADGGKFCQYCGAKF